MTSAAASGLYDDGVLRLPIPPKPWHRTRVTTPTMLLRLRFGRGTAAPVLRVLKGTYPSDEIAWCRERVAEAILDGWSETEDGRARLRERAYRAAARLELNVEGPSPVTVAGVAARKYLTSHPRWTPYIFTFFLETPGGQRVIEFHTEARRQREDMRQVEALLATMEVAGG